MRAYVSIRDLPHYRADAFAAGLTACGFDVDMGLPQNRPAKVAPDDVLVLWNLHRRGDEAADHYHAAGASVLVAENGYIGTDANGHQLYALALDGHNGSGRWPIGETRRWPALGIQDAGDIDWSRDGYALLCAQRGIGSDLMRSPPHWIMDAKRRVRSVMPDIEIRVRHHPGRQKPDRTLEEDLAGARCVVIWSSACGVAALVEGIPVFYDAPFWIGDTLACRLTTTTRTDTHVYRSTLERIAWAQWTLAEIEAGLPFLWLLHHDGRVRSCSESSKAESAALAAGLHPRL